MKIRRHRWYALPIFLPVFAAATAIVMLLWNWLIPSVIGWSAIDYWQSAGLLLLCKMLFGGFGRCRGGRPGGNPHRMMHDHRERIHEHVKNMSAEQRREYIRKHMFGARPADWRDGGDE